MGVGIEVVVGVVANHGGLIERKIAISRFSEPRSSEFCIKHGITEVLGINCHLEFAFNMQDLTYFTCICTNILITSTFLKRGTDFCPKSFEALDQTSSNCLALMSQSRQIITSVDMTYFFADFFRHSQMKTHVCVQKKVRCMLALKVISIWKHVIKVGFRSIQLMKSRQLLKD